jgi:hypothetical protein
MWYTKYGPKKISLRPAPKYIGERGVYALHPAFISSTPGRVSSPRKVYDSQCAEISEMSWQVVDQA